MPMASLKAAGGMAGNPAKLSKADTDLMVDAEVTDPGGPPRGGAAQRRRRSPKEDTRLKRPRQL